MEKPIVAIVIKPDNIECLKYFPSGKSVYKEFYNYKAAPEFLKDSDIVFYGNRMADLVSILETNGVEYDFSGSRILDIVELEKHIHPIDLETLSKKYSENIMPSETQSIIDVFKAQKNIIGSDVPELDVICSNGLKRVDLAGYMMYKDGVVIWNKGKMVGKAVVSDVNFAQKVLEQGIPLETKACIKKLFKR